MSRECVVALAASRVVSQHSGSLALIEESAKNEFFSTNSEDEQRPGALDTVETGTLGPRQASRATAAFEAVIFPKFGCLGISPPPKIQSCTEESN